MRTQRSCRTASAILGLVPAFALVLQSQTAPCGSLDDLRRSKLIEYVQKKYRLPPGYPLQVLEAQAGGCYWKLGFRSLDARKPFQATLFASPDFRFLSHDLLDTALDPVESDRQEKKELLAKLANRRAPRLGDKAAPVVVTVFSDFQCPYCSQAAKALLQDILTRGGVQLEFRHFPLPMHAWAMPAAEVAACARQQDERYFWSFHDYFFEHQKEVNAENLISSALDYAARLAGFDSEALKSCMASKSSAEEVTQDILLGKEIGVTGTPTLFVNGQRIVGYRLQQLRALIEQEMPERRNNQ